MCACPSLRPRRWIGTSSGCARSWRASRPRSSWATTRGGASGSRSGWIRSAPRSWWARSTAGSSCPACGCSPITRSSGGRGGCGGPGATAKRSPARPPAPCGAATSWFISSTASGSTVGSRRSPSGRTAAVSKWPWWSTKAAPASTSRCIGSTRSPPTPAPGGAGAPPPRCPPPFVRRPRREPSGAGGDGEAPPPRLHRLGATTWQRQRDKARAAIRKMASELLDLYARRQLAPGYAFPPDTTWQRELESAFLYEDTPDQRRASEEVKRDMERARPMDRLLVGDVGYGKTEVAVRAAFKAVQAGEQVAVLVPTRILAEQHGRTFRERLADYPIRIEVLSRFRGAKETAPLVQRLAGGDVDIVIGTHRLLSPDVTFKDLGLLIVDEEYRFGVRHKERLKTLKLSVDVLTLTATPIPRTLHLSLAGLRDLALLETAPKDRSPVLTFVEPWDDGLLEEASARELDRGGQVYFVHNRIETIETIAARVQALAPRARVAVAHGQMRESDLEAVMGRFVRGAMDILVSTMIVESGLDVANANTMIVDRADRLGLAQLYQLRGCIGRSPRRAFCYLLVPDLVDAHAEERLQVLEHHTDLGSGYRIALRDLELRGAGNLLGGEQSGHVQAVGFDMNLRWLEEA